MPPKRASLANRIDAPHATTSSDATSAFWGAEREQQAVVELEIRQIMPNRRQPRANPTEANLDELAESIRVHGVIQPVIVREIPLTKYEGHGRTYELIAGERRWRASQIANRTTIPALVRTDTLDHREMLELALIENVQRQDLHPLDEAAAFAQMQEALGYSYAEIAQRIGKSKGYVQNRMRLLQLNDDLRQLIVERPDTISHVYEIARIEDMNLRAELIAAVRDDALSRAETRERVQQLLKGEVSSEPQPEVVVSEEPYFQKYDRDAYHDENRLDVPSPSATASVNTADSLYFQKYDRDNLHGSKPVDDAREALLNQDARTLQTILARWEANASNLTPEMRAMVLRHIDAVSIHLERVIQKLGE